MYNYLLYPHLPRCTSPSYSAHPSLMILSSLVTVASSSSCRDLLRVFNYIIKVSKIAAYLLREEVHVDFSGSNVDDCFNGAEERSPKDDGWIVLVFSHVNNLNDRLFGQGHQLLYLQPFRMFDLPSGAECMSILGAWFRTGADR